MSIRFLPIRIALTVALAWTSPALAQDSGRAVTSKIECVLALSAPPEARESVAGKGLDGADGHDLAQYASRRTTLVKPARA